MEPIITRREKIQWAMEAAGRECTEPIAEALVDILEERGYTFDRQPFVGVHVPGLDALPEQEWLAILDDAVRRAEDRS